MRKFNIKVNGQAYEVEVEEVAGGFAPAPVVPVAAAPAPAVAPVARYAHKPDRRHASRPERCYGRTLQNGNQGNKRSVAR